LGEAIYDPRDLILLVLRMLHNKYQCMQTDGSWEEGLKGFIKNFFILSLDLNTSESPLARHVSYEV